MDLKKHLEEQAQSAKDAVAQYDQDIAAADKAAEIRGIEIGRAQVPVPNPDSEEAEFSQAQLDQYAKDQVATAVAPMQAQIESLTKSLEEKQGEIAAAKESEEKAKADLQAAMRDEETVKAEAVRAFKADLKVVYDQKQVVESAEETGFGQLLE